MSWYVEVFKKYAVFSGRARRREYWYFSLFNFLALVLLELLVVGTEPTSGVATGPSLLLAYLVVGYILASIIPSIAVNVRRLHDIGKSGWFILIGIIPLVGPITLLVFHCMDSEPGTNAYGPNPKEELLTNSAPW